MTLSPAAVRILPFAAFMALLALRGAAPAELAGLDTRWLYGLTVVVVGAMLVRGWSRYDELGPGTAPDARATGLAVAVGLAVFALWISLDAPWMTLSAIAGDTLGAAPAFVPVTASGDLRWDLIVVRFVGAALLVPVMEELFWRSFLMRWVQAGESGSPAFDRVDPRRVGLRAVLMATAVFVLAHTLWLAALIAGLAYAWLYVRTGNLWVAVIAHAVTNAALGVWVVATRSWTFW